MYKKYFKTLFDLTISLSLLLMALPVMILISLLVWITTGPPIFRQQRAGLGGKPFYIYKFRTMTNKSDLNGNLLNDEARLTNFGSFLRVTSLDELPGLFNVLKGDMSLVGPRPLLMEYLPLYSKKQANRHLVRPGITGWAQVNGRNNISWDRKFELDLWYIDNQSFALEIKILWMTIKKVIIRDGVSLNNDVTMKKFKGN